MCFCCVGWGLFLWNYWTTGSFQVCADRAAVEKNAKLLGAQGVAATLDFFVWTSLFELQGASLVAVVMIFDVLPLVLQLCFTAYLFVRLSSSPPCRTSQPECVLRNNVLDKLKYIVRRVSNTKKNDSTART